MSTLPASLGREGLEVPSAPQAHPSPTSLWELLPLPGSYSGSVSPFGGRVRVEMIGAKISKRQTIEARNLRSAEDNGLFSAALRWFEQ